MTAASARRALEYFLESPPTVQLALYCVVQGPLTHREYARLFNSTPLLALPSPDLPILYSPFTNQFKQPHFTASQRPDRPRHGD